MTRREVVLSAQVEFLDDFVANWQHFQRRNGLGELHEATCKDCDHPALVRRAGVRVEE